MAENKAAKEYERYLENRPVVKRMLKFFAECERAEGEQRKRETLDAEFEFDPWPAEAKRARGSYMAAGVEVPERPMLRIPMLDQPLQLVINQERGANLGINVNLEDEGATEAEIEFVQGKIRHIEVKSNAQVARSWAFERACRVGRGYYEVRKVYAHEEATGRPEDFDQRLKICRILNQWTVYLDPTAQEPDWSDGRRALKVIDMGADDYAAQYPDSLVGRAILARQKGGTAENDLPAGTTWNELLADGESGDWLEGDRVRVAEFWEKVTTRTMVEFEGQQRPATQTKVMVRVMTAREVVEETEWDGQYIPIIPVIGKEYNINGKRIWEGMISRAKDPVRLVDYAASAVAEKVGTSVKAPLMMAEGQQEGHENEFVRSMARPLPYVLYKPTTYEGHLVPPPGAVQSGVDIQGDVMLLQMARDFVHTSTFTFDPSLGNVSPKDRSGKAILAQQGQSEESNSNYLDNMATISMPYEGKVLVDLITRLYDREGRRTHIVNPDKTQSAVIVNQPFIVDDSGRPVPVPEGQPAPDGREVKEFRLRPNMLASVQVSVGKSYASRMQKGTDVLGSLLGESPDLMPVIGWRYFEHAEDIPGHSEIAQDLKKLRPAILQDDDKGKPNPEELQAKLGQAAQQIQALTAQLQQAQTALQTKQIEAQGKMAERELTEAVKLEVAKIQSETSIMVAGIKAQLDALESWRRMVTDGQSAAPGLALPADEGGME